MIGSFSKSLSLAGERIGYIAVCPAMPQGDQVVAGLILCNRIDPDAADEAAVAHFVFRRDAEDQATNVAEKLATHELEAVGLAVEATGIRKNHGGEAERHDFHADGPLERQKQAERLQQAAVPAGLLQIVVKALLQAFGQVETSDEVLVGHGHNAEFLVRTDGLIVGLDHGMVVAHGLEQVLLARDEAIDHLIGGDSGGRGGGTRRELGVHHAQEVPAHRGIGIDDHHGSELR